MFRLCSKLNSMPFHSISSGKLLHNMSASLPVLSTRRKVSTVKVCCLGLSLLWFAGCGGSGLSPVRGKIDNGGGGLTTGTVTFHPDNAKNNKSTQIPSGLVEADGTYVLYTESQEGAPAGWYKVTIFAEEQRSSEGAGAYAQPKLLVHPKYAKPETSPLSIEVKSGGVYDLKLDPPQ